ncbi:MAG: AarF/ABC1/UbiB kinase family protein [Thermodesulfobacteriota bacterium]|nr:AarF/ABC1/UbiB kinase family protein [Thermodesulfobacteriota bacterium]
MLSIRKIGIIGRTYRHITRYRQILAVFFRYGFGEFVELFKIEQYLEIGLQVISRKQREQTEHLTRAERVRMAFEELGPTFIKFGQVLSTQPGLIPIDIVNELSKLQDDVPSSPFEPIREVIENELGQPAGEVFKTIDPTPIASASIAQVYAATLHSGEKTALKIRRPGIRNTIEIDLEIMLYLAGLMERHIEEFASHRPTEIVEEFARVLEKELDFTIEATNMERFARQFSDDDTIYTPRVYRDYTTPRMLVLEYIDGIKISDIQALEEEGYDKKLITQRGTDATLKQVFIHGFFHGDPHPGNVFILPGNVICIIDFGMVGNVNLKYQEMFVDLLDCLVHQDAVGTTKVLLQLTIWDDEPVSTVLERDVTDFIGQHLYKPLKEMELGKILQNLLEMLHRHRLRIPPNIFLMIKAIATIENTARQMDPEFNIITYATPFLKKVKLARYTPWRVAGDIIKTASELSHFTRQFPADLLEISRLLKNEKITVNIEHKGIAPLIATYDQVSNRLAFAIIIAALLIGSAMIITTEIPPLVFGISLLGIIGFAGAALMGMWLLVAILRKGRL